MSTISQTLNVTWIGILLVTIIASISLVVALIQQDMIFFEDGAWENAGECIAAPRAYILALWTMIISLVVGSYGFWRSCLNTTKKRTMDIVFSGGASAAGSLTFACFVLFFFFHRFGVEDFDEGQAALFSFGICCFILAMLYFALDVITVRNGGKAKSPSVDTSSLL